MLTMWRGIPVPLLGIGRTCTVNTISVTAQITSSLTAMYHWLQVRPTRGLINDAKPRAAKQARRRTGSASPRLRRPVFTVR